MSSFFRVLVREYTAKLRIPPLFVSRFSSLTPKTVVLFCSSERSWMVDIEEEDNTQLYFKRGWNTFVEDNALEFGDFIVFKFDGNSTFKAKIYEKSYLRRKTSMSVSSFFKIIINEEYTTKLRIPLLFVSRYSSLVPKTVTFIRSYSSDRSWKVDIVEEDDKRLYYKNGWSTFVEDNAVEISSFLVFKFVGDSTFKVKIYGKSACEKELEKELCVNQYYCIQYHNKQITTLDHQITKREIDPIDVRYVTMETVDHGDSNQEIEAPQKEVESHVPIEKTAGNRYESIEGPNLDSKKNPSFKILLQQAYAEKGVMCFPTEFFHKHMKNKRQEVEMETVEGVWTVRLLPHMKRTRTFARLSKGWSEFAKANRFKTGETLVFELTRKGDCPKFVVNRQ
ncbi:hypothetical protein K1719_017822 [Acacia pycnantha]|nr:hypothetical protein K1719_017822 [Acacia pycnantha]